MAEKILPDFAEDAFFLGLIHNIGILAMNRCIDSLQIEYENQAISVSLSFGISFLNTNKNISKIELIKEADSALDQEKGAGRNICKCFETDFKE